MERSASRRRSLQRACDLIHDRAFSSENRPSLPPLPARPAAPLSTAPAKSQKESANEWFRQAVQKEFARLGIT